MESIYYVLTWLCHRKCPHCYEGRFHPYRGEELKRVLSDAVRNAPRVIANLPARLTYLDRSESDERGAYKEKTGRIILAGGEVLLKSVREQVLYPSLHQIADKYRAQGGVKVVIQTTGDQITPEVIDELLRRGVWMISVSGIDGYHRGLETESAREAVRAKLVPMFDRAGMKQFQEGRDSWSSDLETGPWYSFWGATPGSWIGRLWPRGRALANGLTLADMTDNFCKGWSGGIHFLDGKYNGSEVSIDPDGNVFPCCLKTKRPLGNLTETTLAGILESVRGNPVYEAISCGHPERMGMAYGWSEGKFLSMCTVQLPSGKSYQNLCFGCDRFHETLFF
jgi:MoaA/NifB/PqqE/SkfB family radical SAM enzyme